MKYIASIFFILLSVPAFSCDCKTIKNLSEAQKLEFKESDLVFIGEVVTAENDKDNYKIKVIELFKGNPKSKVLVGTEFNSCTLIPRKGDGLWLVYADVLSDGSIVIHDCGLSRSYNYPYALSDEIYMPPPPKLSKDRTMDELCGEIELAEYKAKALQVLRAEIEQLRKMK